LSRFKISAERSTIFFGAFLAGFFATFFAAAFFATFFAVAFLAAMVPNTSESHR